VGEPAAEVNIDAELVSSLLSSQHPDLVGLGLKEVGSGWDNAIFRVGTDLAVRLPRRLMSVPLILHEQKWLSEIAPHLPAAIPVPLRAGAPGAGFPWPWSITPWFAGSTADRASLAEVQTCAGQLGLFLRSLHRPAPTDAPRNPCRGMPLAPRDQLTRPGIEALDEAIDHELVWRTWERLRDTPAWTGLPVWIHGDLHPFNLILSKGGLAAVIDWGDISLRQQSPLDISAQHE